MRKLIALGAILMSTQAMAQQPAPDVKMIPMNAREQQLVLEMCESALWASRQRFDGLCNYLTVKFSNAAAQQPAPAKPADAPPPEAVQPK